MLLLKSLVLIYLASSTFALVYHGIIKENARIGDRVELDKPLYVRNMTGFVGEVCGYTIHKAFSDLPFRVVLLEPFSGGASVVVDGRLDFEERQGYSFLVSAHDCRDPVNMTHSEREKIEVSVEDVNDNPPRWVDSLYSVSVGNLLRTRQQLVCLQVTDDDIGKKFSDICRFTLFDPSERFYVDNKGCIYNKEVLTGPTGSRVSHSLKVFAQDCGGLVTEGVDVHVEWIPVCTFSWKGYDRSVELSEFSDNSTSLPLFREVEFYSCEDNGSCEVASLSVTLELSSGSEGGCRRDRESLAAQRAFCGLKEDPAEPMLLLLDNETSFDGNSTFLEIPAEGVVRRLEGDTFLISVWMKRSRVEDEEEDDEDGGGVRHQILCSSEDSRITRRHTMWYVEGCKMVFVMRRMGSNLGEDRDKEGGGGGLGEEKVESQWEWNVPELCGEDRGWHHYAIASANSGEMHTLDLYVDGRMFTNSKSDLRIIRKWKLHPLSHPPSPRLVVGACWMGRHGRMEEVFDGWLSGLTLLTNQTDVDQIVKCLSQCHERLTLEKIDDIQSGTYVVLSEDKTHLVINSTSPDLLRDVLREVDLLLPSPRPDPGSRVVTVSTDVVCKNSERVSFDSNDLEIVVSRPHPLKISTGRIVLVDEADLIGGVRIMEEFKMEEVVGGTAASLESCFVRSDSSMDLNREMFLFDGDLLRELDLQVDLNGRGLFVGRVGGIGENSEGSLKSYERFMRSLRYSNKAWPKRKQRSFVVGCLGLNEMLLTNHVKVLIQLIPTHLESLPPPDNVGKNDLVVEQPMIMRSNVASVKDDTSGIGFWLPIFLVVCIGLIITLVILGVSRLRERRSDRTNAADMEWDNSEMSIAVNPLYEMDDLNSMDRSEVFDDNEVDNGGDDDDDEDADETTGEGGTNEETRRDLEWDDLPY